MDRLFHDLFNNKHGQSNKSVAVIAENFSFTEDQARFLKATIALPSTKNLVFRDDLQKVLIQFGSIQKDIRQSVESNNWLILDYNDFSDNVCDKIQSDIFGRSTDSKHSLIYLNDISRFELLTNYEESNKLLMLVEKLKRLHKSHTYSIVILYQNNSNAIKSSKLLRNLLYLSDGFVKVKTSKKYNYLMNICYQGGPALDNEYIRRPRTLIPKRHQSYKYSCEIGRNYWAQELLCFFRIRLLPARFNFNEEVGDDEDADNAPNQGEINEKELTELLKESTIDQRLEENDGDNEQTLQPYTQARDPKQSRIFYYPDKNDDIDEDDPDDDLNF